MDNQEKPTSANRIPEAQTPEQAKWVVWRVIKGSDKAAAKEAGVHPSTVSKWENKKELDAAVLRLCGDPVDAVLSILEDYAIMAALVKVSGLKSRKETVKQATATEILDRNIGKPKQSHELTGKDAGPFEIVLSWGDADAGDDADAAEPA